MRDLTRQGARRLTFLYSLGAKALAPMPALPLAATPDRSWVCNDTKSF